MHIYGSQAKPYELQKKGNVYSCSCSIWRNIADLAERRTCRHLIQLRGERMEIGRVGEEGIKKSEATTRELQRKSMESMQATTRQLSTPPVQSSMGQHAMGQHRVEKRPGDPHMHGRDLKRQTT